MTRLDHYRAWVEKRSLLWFGVVCAVFAYPVISADILHRDDLWRISSGLYSWAPHGRPMADIATQVLTLSGTDIIDVAPFSQMVFAFCLVVGFAITTGFFRREYGEAFVLATSVLFLNPFFLGNILYQFDALGMGLAIALTAVAFAMMRRFEVLRLAYSVIILVIVLALYQPILNLLIGLCALQVAVMTVKGQSLRAMLQAVGLRATQFISAYAIYYIAIGIPLRGVSDRSETISPGVEGLLAMVETATAFVRFVVQFTQSESATFVFLLLLFFASAVLGFGNMLVGSAQRRLLIFGLLLALVLSILSFFGPLILVKDMLISYRTVPSSAAPLAILTVFIGASRLLWPAFCIPLFLSILLSFQTLAAYKSQRAHDTFVAQLVVSDLNNFRQMDATVFSIGAVSPAPSAKNSRQMHPMIRALADPAGGWIFERLLIQHGLTNAAALWSYQRDAVEARIRTSDCGDITLLKETDFYALFQLDGVLLVVLDGAENFPCKV